MADEIIRMQDIYAEDIVGNINEVREARGTFESLDARLDNIDGNAPSPSTSDPAMDGTASPGSADTYSRGDHVHPTDTSRQAVIDSSHKLSSDLVDDANNTHKFATVAQLQQIETNKTNILSLDTEIDSVANLGAKNLLDFGKWASNVPVYNGTKSYSNGVMTVTATGSGCVTYHNQYFPEALKIPVKEGEKYTITWDTTATTNIGFFQLCPNGNAISGTDVNIADKQTEYTVASGVTYLTYRVGVWASGNSINISKLMLRPATISDSSYQPYAMSNAELTAGVSNWDSYDCLDQTHPNDIDINNSELTVYHNAFLKRVVISCKIKFLLQRTSASTALLIGNMANIPNYTKLIPLNSVREFVSTSDYDAFIAKNATNYVIAFAVNSGTLAANTEIRAQFEYTYF